MFFQSFLYNLLVPIVFVLYLPMFIIKLMKRGGAGASFWERFGIFSKEKKAMLRQLDRPVWVHAVSVGEAVAALNMIRQWQIKEPGVQVVLSTTTTTGQALARHKKPENVVLIYAPIDFRCAVRATLRKVRPSKLVIFEVEIWPNLIIQTKKMGAKLALVNCRVSDNSFKGYSRHAWFFKKLFHAFDLICVQTPEDKRRVDVISGGVHSVACHTMKFDQTPDVDGVYTKETLNAFFDTERPILFNAASTHPGEEALMLDTYKSLRQAHPSLRLILVPRHVERTPEIVTLIQQSGLSYNLYQNESTGVGADVLLVNVTGELMSLLALSDIVFVGKSLAGNKGGHNIIEPAVFGKPILHGPDMQNFKLVAEMFHSAGAALTVTEEDIGQTISALLQSEAEIKKLSSLSRKVVTENRGAIKKTLFELSNL